MPSAFNFTSGPFVQKMMDAFARIGSGFFKLEAFDHAIPAAAIDDGQPAGRRVQPQFGGHVHIAQGKQPILSYRGSRIFRRTEADVVAVEIAAGWIRRGERPEIVVDSRRMALGSAVSYCETDCIDHSTA